VDSQTKTVIMPNVPVMVKFEEAEPGVDVTLIQFSFVIGDCFWVVTPCHVSGISFGTL